jgi:very-short-patch-repair endonuclease
MRTPRPWTLPTQPVTRALLLASGVTDAMIRTELRAGRLVHVRPGVVLCASAWPDGPLGQHLMRAHAEQVMNPSAVISHGSAAAAWGLPSPDFHDWHDDPVSLTLPDSANGSRRRAVSWHVAPLPAAHVTRDAEGYAVTTIARTAVDLAQGRRLPEALVILDGGARLLVAAFVGRDPRRRDYVNPRFVKAARDELLLVAARSAALRRTIGVVEPCRESAAESTFTGHLVLAGLPMPQFQAPLKTPMGTFYPDFYWPEARLIGECDGAVKYGSPEAILLEKQREEWLRDEAYRFVRWPAKHSWTRPQEILGRIERYLGL